MSTLVNLQSSNIIALREARNSTMQFAEDAFACAAGAAALAVIYKIAGMAVLALSGGQFTLVGYVIVSSPIVPVAIGLIAGTAGIALLASGVLWMVEQVLIHRNNQRAANP